MFGDHDHETALRICFDVSEQVGQPCRIFRSKNDPTKWTIGVPAKSFSPDELEKLLTLDDLKRLRAAQREEC